MCHAPKNISPSHDKRKRAGSAPALDGVRQQDLVPFQLVSSCPAGASVLCASGRNLARSRPENTAGRVSAHSSACARSAPVIMHYTYFWWRRRRALTGTWPARGICGRAHWSVDTGHGGQVLIFVLGRRRLRASRAKARRMGPCDRARQLNGGGETRTPETVSSASAPLDANRGAPYAMAFFRLGIWEGCVGMLRDICSSGVLQGVTLASWCPESGAA